MLIYEQNLKAKTDSDNWIRVTSSSYPTEKAQYKSDTITLSTQYSYDANSCNISIGPPVLPIIPLFFFCSGIDYFHLIFMIENSNNEFTIDINEIKLISNDEVRSISDAYYCAVNEGYYCSSNDRRNIKIGSNEPIILNKGRFLIHLSFVKIGKPEELSLVFGKIFSEGKQINIPSLKFQKNNRIAYVPLMLSGHEPAYRFK